MERETDMVLSAVAWGTAACASLLAHSIVGGLATPVVPLIDEVRIEVVSLPPVTTPRAAPSPQASVGTALAQPIDAKAPGPATPAAVQREAPGEAHLRLPDPTPEPPKEAGLFRDGPKRPNLFERNRRYAARQTALQPLKRRLENYEAGQRRRPIDLTKTYACGGADVEAELETKERDVGHWAPFVPHQLLPENYAEGLAQVLTRDGKRTTTPGYVELALPAETLVLELEEPPGALISVGLSHARCAVGLSHSRRGFPMTWRRIPMRFATAEGAVIDAVVDATLHEDATFLLKSLDGTRLPFRTGRVQHGDQIASRLTALSAIARFFD